MKKERKFFQCGEQFALTKTKCQNIMTREEAFEKIVRLLDAGHDVELRPVMGGERVEIVYTTKKRHAGWWCWEESPSAK